VAREAAASETVTIGHHFAQTLARIEQAARACGRDPAGVRLVAVSKTQPPERIREAYAAGQRAFGENYAQELAAKAEALADLRGLEWHFIGHLQTNKAKVVAKYADLVHTVDSAALASELGKRVTREGRTAPLPVLVEVNVGDEPQKAGVAPGDLAEVLAAVRAQSSLSLRGLMTLPPAQDLAVARRVFETVVTLRNLHGGKGALPELSFGMTADLEIAIACGATMVRIGTGIFGPRGS
jgi:pyridoxal phosphate enzyme (YggS family)